MSSGGRKFASLFLQRPRQPKPVATAWTTSGRPGGRRARPKATNLPRTRTTMCTGAAMKKAWSRAFVCVRRPVPWPGASSVGMLRRTAPTFGNRQTGWHLSRAKSRCRCSVRRAARPRPGCWPLPGPAVTPMWGGHLPASLVTNCRARRSAIRSCSNRRSTA